MFVICLGVEYLLFWVLIGLSWLFRVWRSQGVGGCLRVCGLITDFGWVYVWWVFIDLICVVDVICVC